MIFAFWRPERAWWQSRLEAKRRLEAIWRKHVGELPHSRLAERLLWVRWLVERGKIGNHENARRRP